MGGAHQAIDLLEHEGRRGARLGAGRLLLRRPDAVAQGSPGLTPQGVPHDRQPHHRGREH